MSLVPEATAICDAWVPGGLPCRARCVAEDLTQLTHLLDTRGWEVAEDGVYYCSRHRLNLWREPR